MQYLFRFSLKALVFLAFLSIPSLLSAQSKVDSLLSVLKTETKDTTRVKLMYIIAEEFQNSNLDLAKRYIEDGLALSKKISYKKGIATILRKKAELLLAGGEVDTALVLLKQTWDIIKTTNYNDEKVMVLRNIGNTYFLHAEYPEALKYYEQTLRMAQDLKDDKEIGMAYGNFAAVFHKQGDFKKGIEYDQKALYHFRKSGNELRIAQGLHSIGVDYFNMDSIDQSAKYFNEALILYRKIKNKDGEATALQNLSLTYTHLPTRLKYQLEAQAIWDKFNPRSQLSITNLGNIGNNYAIHYVNDSIRTPGKQKKEYLIKAEYYFNRGLEYSRKNNDKNEETNLLYNISQLKVMQNDYKAAYQYITESYELSDSIYSQENKNKIAAIESKREIEKRDNEIEISRLALSNERRTRWALIGGSFLLFIIGAMLFYQNKQRKKNNDKLREINAELDEANRIKMRFFSILNHDLRSPVSNVLSFVRLQQSAGDAIDDETKSRLQTQTISSAENLLNSMEDLLLWSKGQMEQFKPVYKDVAVSKLFEDTQKHFQSLNNVSMVFENPEDLTLHTDVDYLKTIVRNLTANAVKAMGQNEGSQIIWRAWSEGNDRYLSITDNGPGGTEEQFRALYDETATVGIKTGLGLHLIRDLAKAIDCKVAVQSNPGEGTKIELQFMSIESKRAV